MLNVVLDNLFKIADIVTQTVEHVGDNVCEDPGVMKAVRFIGYLLAIAKLFVPVIIICWGSIDLYKAVIGGSADSIKKQTKVLLFRVILGVAIFLLPGLINWVLTSVHGGDNQTCVSCLLDPFSCG